VHAYAYAYAMTKVISLSEEAYRTLKDLKRKGESFSDVIIRIAGSREARSLAEFAGRWAGADLDAVFGEVLREREEVRSREL